MREASMVDMIAKAYRVDPNSIVGGPSWLETDRFDVRAKTPPNTTLDGVNQMLRTLLAERFKLMVHTEIRPMPGFVLSAGKGAPKMVLSQSSTEPNCRYKPQPELAPEAIMKLDYICQNTTMDVLAENLHDWAGGVNFNKFYITGPTVNATGLKGGWDFELRWNAKGDLQRAGADGISLFDAVDKQLGLKLEAKTYPMPVIIVDSANEMPAENSVEVTKMVLPPPPTEFEVATVKPSAPNEMGFSRFTADQVLFQASTLQLLIAFAYNIDPDRLVGAPDWLKDDKFTILAKISNDARRGSSQGAPLDIDDIQPMLRKLLADRFNLRVHMEDRPFDAYNLVAVKPKLKPANPANRTACKEGPGDDCKDPRIANPVLGRLLTCRNMTLTEFAANLQARVSGSFNTPVVDATGIEGRYDITLSFSRAAQLEGSGTTSTEASVPTGGVSFFDAVERELGLKFVKVKRPIPVVVIDHVDKKPVPN